MARRFIIIAAHVGLYAVAYALAWLLRFDFALKAEYQRTFLVGLGLMVAIRTAAGFPFDVYGGVLRYAGIQDLINIVKAVTMGTAGFVLAAVLLNLRDIPRSIYALDWFAALVLMGGLRFALRVAREVLVKSTEEQQLRRLLILGAGDAGESLLRDIQRKHRERYQVVGFLDDDVKKRGLRIHGVKVLGPLYRLGDYVARHRVDEVIVAIPSARGEEMRDILNICRVAGVQPKTVPGVEQLINGMVSVQQLRPVAIEDLLGRQPVQLDEALISRFLRDRAVLVTGAGGSIGAELCRQICRYAPKKLLLLDRSEPALFQIHKEIQKRYPTLAPVPLIADVTDRKRLEQVFSAHRPQVVFHAAAHKHVPMMEWNPGEAVKNNIGGTMTAAELAHQGGAESFVFISTDKAVNPSSIMGATKRASEIYVQALSRESKTIFTAVRFGNVMGSTGSVIPIFQEQVAAGGPVTVTHPEMKRYFMTIPESCQLVMQAAAMGEGGEIFVLDMGEPVRIVDLARDLIKLSGLEPERDVRIEFTGLRPGEKLFEEFGFDEEKMRKTRHSKIYIGKLTPHPLDEIRKRLVGLLEEIQQLSEDQIAERLQIIVPEFAPASARPADAAAQPVLAAAEARPETVPGQNPALDSAWELAVSLARQAGFLDISWCSHGVKPPDKREATLSEDGGGERARMTRSVPLGTLAFLEMVLHYPGRAGRRTPDHIRRAARQIDRQVLAMFRGRQQT